MLSLCWFLTDFFACEVKLQLTVFIVADFVLNCLT